MPASSVLLLLLAIALFFLIWAARQPWFGRAMGRGRPPARRAATGETIVVREPGDTPDGVGQPTLRALLVAAAVLLALVLVVQVPRTLMDANEQFLVLVAPFRDENGAVGQTGRSAAAQLAAELPAASGGTVAARLLDQAPADIAAAVALADREGADALIWGEIAAGGMLDQESLRPLLIYRPSGPYAPHGWDGYTGRFATPSVYALSSGLVNGQVVLPRLMQALAQYGAGELDPAFANLGALVEQYPALAPALPRALRGNILWARGDHAEAAGEYRRAGVMETSAEQASEMALLANNLGAILQDGGDQAAEAAFAKAVELLKGQDLRELRLNLALGMLQADRADEAVVLLEPLAGAAPAPVLLALAEAYRAEGAFDRAEQTLGDAERQIEADDDLAVASQRPLVRQRLTSALLEQRATLQLSRAFGGGRPILWEIQSTDTLPADLLDEPRKLLGQAVEQANELVRGWNRRAAAADAAQNPQDGQVALGQARRATADLRERERWLAAVEIEVGQTRAANRRGLLNALWASLRGDRSPAARARNRLQELAEQQPEDVATAVLLGHAQLQLNERAAASTLFDQAAIAAPLRPEPVYGQALVALPDDRARARALMAGAIALDSDYYPAREKLAEVAAEDGDWPVVVEQRRWLAANHGGTAAELALAAALREGGPGGYAEAEQILLPLANQNRVDALLELNRLYQAVGDAAAAQAALERARQAAPDDAQAAYELGLLLAARGERDEAIAQLQAAVERDEDHVQAHLALAQLYAAEGNAAGATDQYRIALDRGASDVASLKQIGTVLLEGGEYDRAADAFRRALEADPNDAEAHHGLAQAYLEQNRLDPAEDQEQVALDLRGGTYPAALVGLGDVALERNNLELAVERYNAAIAQDASLTAAYLGLGRASARAGNWSVAQAHFQSAVSRDPESAEARRWLGAALVEQRDAGAAQAEFARAIELRPDYAEAYYGLAQAQNASGQPDAAASSLAQALKLQPKYAEARLLEGKLYEQRGALPEAIDAYSAAIAADARLVESYYRRALLYIRDGKITSARRDLEQAARRQENFPEAQYWLGRVYLIEGRFGPARDAFGRAVEQRGGNYAEARFYQGLAEEQLGQRDAAIASFNVALEQDQTSAWAGDAQAALTRLGQ